MNVEEKEVGCNSSDMMSIGVCIDDEMMFGGLGHKWLTLNSLERRKR